MGRKAIGRVLKLVAVGAIATAVFFFGLHFGPTPDRGAEAKVFERLILLTRDMPEYLFDDRATSEPRTIMVNGNTTYMRVGSTRDDIAAVLDFYAEQYAPQPLRLIDEGLVNRIEDEETKDCVKRAIRFMDCLGSMQHFRLDRGDFGFWSGFEFHDAEPAIGTEAFIRTTESALSTGKLGKVGIGRTVIALRDRATQETTIINMWTDRDFDLGGLTSNGFGDMPGIDIESVPRYPGNRRILCIEQENSRTKDTVVVYEGGGSLAGNILFYHGRMKRAGWHADRGFKELTRGQDRENVLFYTRRGRECTIAIHRDPETGSIITTVIDRTTV